MVVLVVVAVVLVAAGCALVPRFAQPQLLQPSLLRLHLHRLRLVTTRPLLPLPILLQLPAAQCLIWMPCTALRSSTPASSLCAVLALVVAALRLLLALPLLLLLRLRLQRGAAAHWRGAPLCGMATRHKLMAAPNRRSVIMMISITITVMMRSRSRRRQRQRKKRRRRMAARLHGGSCHSQPLPHTALAHTAPVHW